METMKKWAQLFCKKENFEKLRNFLAYIKDNDLKSYILLNKLDIEIYLEILKKL